MGKRRGSRGKLKANTNNLSWDQDVEMVERNPISPKLSKTQKKKRQKQQKGLRDAFMEKCLMTISEQSDRQEQQLPYSKAVADDVNPEVLSYLQQFIAKYLDFFDNPNCRMHLQEFYEENATLTVESCASFSMNGIQALGKKNPVCPLWSMYEPLTCNTLPGACPQPSWSLYMHVKDKYPEIKIAGHLNPRRLTLDKNQRSQQKIIKTVQDKRIKELCSYVRSVEASDEWRRTDLPKPPEPRHMATGLNQILGILTRFPPCKHIRSDRCCQLDVPSVSPSGIIVRFSCLMVEVIPPSIVKDIHPANNKQVLLFDETRAAVVRVIQRTIIIKPHPVNKIVLEDIAIFPAPLEQVRSHTKEILEALFGAQAEIFKKSLTFNDQN